GLAPGAAGTPACRGEVQGRVDWRGSGIAGDGGRGAAPVDRAFSVFGSKRCRWWVSTATWTFCPGWISLLRGSIRAVSVLPPMFRLTQISLPMISSYCSILYNFLLHNTPYTLHTIHSTLTVCS